MDMQGHAGQMQGGACTGAHEGRDQPWRYMGIYMGRYMGAHEGRDQPWRYMGRYTEW